MSDNQVTHATAELVNYLQTLYNGASSDTERAIIDQVWHHIETLGNANRQLADANQKLLVGLQEAIAQRDKVSNDHKKLIDDLENLNDDNPMVMHAMEGVWETAQEEAEHHVREQAEDDIYNQLHEMYRESMTTVDPRYEDILRELPVYRYLKDIIYTLNDMHEMTEDQQRAFIQFVRTYAEAG